MAESLFTQIAWPKGRPPKRAEVFALLEEVMPWQELEALIGPHYFTPNPHRNGRPPYPIKTMLRAHFLQWVCRLSDEGTENEILDSHSAARFVGLDPWRPRPPGATAIRKFRLLLQIRPLHDDVSLAIRIALLRANVEIRPGTIVQPIVRRYRGKP